MRMRIILIGQPFETLGIKSESYISFSFIKINDIYTSNGLFQ